MSSLARFQLLCHIRALIRALVSCGVTTATGQSAEENVRDYGIPAIVVPFDYPVPEGRAAVATAGAGSPWADYCALCLASGQATVSLCHSARGYSPMNRMEYE